MKSIRDTEEMANQEEHLCHLEDIGNKLHLHPALAAGHARRESAGKELRSGFGGDAPSQLKAFKTQGVCTQ